MSDMVNRNLVRELDAPEEGRELEATSNEPFPSPQPALAGQTGGLVTGKVLRVTDREVWIDVGAKGPGVVPREEWEPSPPPCPSDAVEVLIEPAEEEDGAPRLSYRKARFERQWREFVGRHEEGDTVSATVTARITGGLQVDVGVPAFLPASQVDVRRPPDLAPFVGRALECKILIIDPARRNVIVSRRAVLEVPLRTIRRNLLAEIEPGQVRTGVVRNVAEFGAFVDLGGIDGLLHVTDMAWSRVHHPRHVVRIDETVEVYVLSVDRDRERIALSLKHKTPNPWPDLAERFPAGSRHAGEVTSVTSYGAWVKLAPGPEGLVHLSEMSWTRRLADTSECVAVGDEIEVQVLSVKPEKQELSLGMRQVMPNPWDKVAERYPPGATVPGVVLRLANYGAFVGLEADIEGLVHLMELRRTRALAHPSEVVSPGDRVTCVVLNVDSERRRIALGLPDQPEEAHLAVRSGTEGAPRADLPGQPRLPVEVLDWRDRFVVRMAREVREARAFDGLPILADALEDAGCVEEAILAHLRDRGPHARRCWVLDLILGQR